MTSPAPRLAGLDLVRAAAIVLVVNSHLEIVTGVWHLAYGGGTLGNVLFLFLSGAGLALSRRAEPKALWVARRLVRVLPLFYLAMILKTALIARPIATQPWSWWLDHWLLVGGYGWFIRLILIGYAGIFLVEKVLGRWHAAPLILAALAFLAYAVARPADANPYLFFAVPLFAGHLLMRSAPAVLTSGTWADLLAAVGLAAVATLLQLRVPSARVVLPFVYVGVAVLATRGAARVAPVLPGTVRRAAAWIARISYAWFLAHVAISHTVKTHCAGWPEAATVAVFLGVSLGLAALLDAVDERLRARLLPS